MNENMEFDPQGWDISTKTKETANSKPKEKYTRPTTHLTKRNKKKKCAASPKMIQVQLLRKRQNYGDRRDTRTIQTGQPRRAETANQVTRRKRPSPTPTSDIVNGTKVQKHQKKRNLEPKRDVKIQTPHLSRQIESLVRARRIQTKRDQCCCCSHPQRVRV